MTMPLPLLHLSRCLLIVAALWGASCGQTARQGPPSLGADAAPASPADAGGNCFPACAALARVFAGVKFDTSPCRYSAYVDDAGPSAALRNTCFASGGRLEERTLPDGTHEIRTFAPGKTLAALITTISSSGVSTFDGTTNARLLRVSFSDPTHLTLDCDGQSVVTTPDEFKRCFGTSMPAGNGRSQCEPGRCP